MVLFFKDASPTTAAPALEKLAGTWSAKFTSVDIGLSSGLDSKVLPPFEFTIKAEGGGYAITLPKSPPIPLVTEAGRLVAQRETNKPALALTPAADGSLHGELELDAAKAKGGRVEFHATLKR